MSRPLDKDKEAMLAATTDDEARDWARRLEDREAARSGATLSAARKRVASRLGVPVGTLENLRRDRLKGVREWLYKRLQAALVSELQREHQALEHELAILTRHGRNVPASTLAEIEADLERARRALATRTIGASDILVEVRQ